MKKLIPAIMLLISTLAFGSLTYSQDVSGGVVDLDPIEDTYQSIVLRGAQSEFDGSDPDWGAVLAVVCPDSAGVFPTSVMIPGSFVVIPSGCIACGICVATCPVDAITQDDDGIAVIDPDLCIVCGICAGACPVNTIFAPSASTVYALFGITEENEEVFLQGIEQ